MTPLQRSGLLKPNAILQWAKKRQAAGDQTVLCTRDGREIKRVPFIGGRAVAFPFVGPQPRGRLPANCRWHGKGHFWELRVDYTECRKILGVRDMIAVIPAWHARQLERARG